MKILTLLISLAVISAQNVAAADDTDRNAIAQLTEDSPSEYISDLAFELRKNAPNFFALGGNDGKMYVITDPHLAPFVLSDTTPLTMTYQEALGWDEEVKRPGKHWWSRKVKVKIHHPGYCESIGAMLPSYEQLGALGRAMHPDGPYGKYNPNAIAGMSENIVWSWLHGDAFAYAFHGLSGTIYESSIHAVVRYVRCVRPI